MTDWPEAVREWEQNTRFPHGSMYKSYKSMRDGADAAIAPLKALVLQWHKFYYDAVAANERLVVEQRNTQAEVERLQDSLKRERSLYDSMTLVASKTIARAEKAEAEVRRLQDSLKQSHIAYGDKYAEVERLKWMLDEAWTERRKIRSERKYGINLRTKKMWLADLAARYENG